MSEKDNVMRMDHLTDKLLSDENAITLFVEEVGRKIAGERDTIEAILVHMFGIYVKNTSMKTHLFVNSESSAGKSYICNCIKKIFPEEFFEYRTKITPEVLTYWHNAKYEPEWDWDGKILYLEDVKDDVINSATFKVMASEGSTATVVIKQRAIDIKINGSPIILLTSANALPNAEIINRFSIINLDETPAQTTRVIKKQLEDSIKLNNFDYEPEYMEALRRLDRVEVLLPSWINNLSEFFQTDSMRVRRDIGRFIDLMKSSAAFYQRQRDYNELEKIVIADERDYEVARKVNEKLSDAGGSFGLTHRLKKCYNFCVEYYKESDGEQFSASDMLKYKPVVSERAWRTILDKLSQKGLLSVDIKTNETGGRPSTVFYPNSTTIIKLPRVTEVKEVKVVKTVKEEKEVSKKKGICEKLK